MDNLPRKKSPRAPSISLDEALIKAIKIYDRERLHPAPTEVVAQSLGYKSANNGSALSTLASLRYYGLLERPKEGFLMVSKDVESYKFSPDEHHRRLLLLGFLKRPMIFNDLLEKYNSGLPSDANLKFELIQRDFSPQSAEAVLSVFKKSVDFSSYFSGSNEVEIQEEFGKNEIGQLDLDKPLSSEKSKSMVLNEDSLLSLGNEQLDRIPIRLPGGRRAWIIIPALFYEADKDRIKSQIDLLLTEEDEM